MAKLPFYCLFLLNLLTLSPVVVCSFSLTRSVTHSRSFFLQPLFFFLPLCSTFDCHFHAMLRNTYIYNLGGLQTVCALFTDKTDTNPFRGFFSMKYFCWVKVFEEGAASSHPLAQDTILEMAESCLQRHC